MPGLDFRLCGVRFQAMWGTEREMALVKPDDTRNVVTLNTAEPYTPEGKQEEEHYPVGDVEHEITISTGPSSDSQMDAVKDFLDLLVSNLKNLPIAAPQAAKLLALAIQMKQLGPKGDEMADIISPPADDQGAQQQAAIQQGQQQMQAMQEQFAQMQAELQKLQMEKAGKVIEGQFKAAEADKDREVKLAVAEIETKAQSVSERMSIVEDLVHKIMDQGHAAAMQASQQQHAQELAANQQAAAQQAQGSDQLHEQGMAAAGQSHEQQMAEQQAEQATEQQDNSSE